MSFVVAKEFKTVNRKFAEGVAIGPADVAGSPVGWDDLRQRGFVKPANLPVSGRSKTASAAE